MSRASRLTRKQKEFISMKGLVAKNWLLLSDDDSEMVLVSKGAGKTRRLKK